MRANGGETLENKLSNNFGVSRKVVLFFNSPENRGDISLVYKKKLFLLSLKIF